MYFKEESNVREIWNDLPVDFDCKLSYREMQGYGGSQKYGTGGRWINDKFYVSFGGNKSKGAVPKKVKTKDGYIVPISPRDVEVFKDFLISL